MSMGNNDFFQTTENLVGNQKEDSESSNAAGSNQCNSKSNTAQNCRPKIDELLASEDVEPYYKFATPTFVQELDWAITFSKYDFPWHEVRFGIFSAKECFRMYTSQIRDA